MVKRYGESCWGSGIYQKINGEYVKYEDYATLQAENERLKADRVDLEQFRDLVARAWTDGSIDRSERDRLLALIDGQAACPTVEDMALNVQDWLIKEEDVVVSVMEIEAAMRQPAKEVSSETVNLAVERVQPTKGEGE